MSAASKLLARQASRKVPSGARIADLPVMLAVLSVEQSTGITATRVREETPPEQVGDQPARMAVIFAPPAVRPSLPKGMAGAFHAAVAARLSMGGDGENGVYSGV
ncbi:MAG: hypothetical protein J7485_01910 [Sphingobium sp.]|nr:hypothetical protein [Sphingobium sp.]